MKVILLQNIKGFGQIGDVKNVSDGYAKNLLFPRKLAKIATASALKEVEHLKKRLDVALKLEHEQAAAAVGKFADLVVTFARKASSAGRLFSSVTKEEIAKELTKLAGVHVTKEMLDLGEHGEHIKQIGTHLITVELAHDISAQVNVTITAEE